MCLSISYTSSIIFNEKHYVDVPMQMFNDLCFGVIKINGDALNFTKI